MGITITTAPCCWGVDDVTNPNLPSWERVFDEVAAAGYGGLELGPYGYVPLDLPRVSEALRARGLFIVAGTIFDDLVSPANRENLLRQTDEICALVAQLPQPAPGAGQRYATPYLTVMDWGHDERDYAAGHSDRAPRLSDADWDGMVANIRAIAARARQLRRARRASIRTPEATSNSPTRSSASHATFRPRRSGLCLDTGHCYYAGIDPVAALERYADRARLHPLQGHRPDRCSTG